jgi:hypothetical protein
LETLKNAKEGESQGIGISDFWKLAFWESRRQEAGQFCIEKTPKGTAVIWEVVTWTKIWPRGLITVSSISAFRYFGDREIEESRTLDIRTQGVPGPEILFSGKRSTDVYRGHGES